MADRAGIQTVCLMIVDRAGCWVNRAAGYFTTRRKRHFTEAPKLVAPCFCGVGADRNDLIAFAMATVPILPGIPCE